MSWFEDDGFWEALYPAMFDEARFTAAGTQVEQLLALSGMNRGSVLDLCCGPGRHSAVFAQKGWNVTAVDFSGFMLDKARQHTASGPPIEFVQADAREFVRPGAFDLAISMFTSCGGLATHDEDLAMLSNIRTSLKPDGVAIVEVLGKECLAARLRSADWDRLADGSIAIEHREIQPGWDRMKVERVLVAGDRARHFEFVINLYSGQELAAALRQAGFAKVDLFGSLRGTPYDANATHLIARAQA